MEDAFFLELPSTGGQTLLRLRAFTSVTQLDEEVVCGKYFDEGRCTSQGDIATASRGVILVSPQPCSVGDGLLGGALLAQPLPVIRFMVLVKWRE